MQDGVDQGQRRPWLPWDTGSILAPVVAAVVGVFLVFGWLGGDRLVGDEHNAIHFLRDGFLDYIRSFHYGHVLKAQFWATHAFFGNSFFWYRFPAAVSVSVFILWLAFYRTDALPCDRVTQAAIVLFIASNQSLLFFARWGMSSYGESIACAVVLLALLMPDVAGGRLPVWTKWRLLLVAVLPWLYPSMVILLGGLSVGLGVLVLLPVLSRKATVIWSGFVRRMVGAAVPLFVGGGSFVVYRLLVPDEHWNRARGHHVALEEWLQGGEGGVGAFVLHSLGRIGHDLLEFARVGGAHADSLQQAYAVLGVCIAVATLVALAVVTVRAGRLRTALPPLEQGYLRAGWVLAICLVSSLLVVVGAQLLNAFPVGGLRHLFFIIPPLALLSVFSTAYLVHLAIRMPGLNRGFLRGAAATVASLAVLLAGGVIATVVAKDRIADRHDWDALFALFHSPANDIALSFSPGFFVSPRLYPGPGRYFMSNAGSELPRDFVQAVNELVDAGDGGRVAVLARPRALADPASALNAFIIKEGLDIEQTARAGAFVALELAVPQGSAGSDRMREVAFEVDLPVSPIVSVRFNPTGALQARVLVESVVLVDAEGEHPVDICADAALQLVRTLRSAHEGKCLLLIGDGSNTGWIAPSALRNLGPASHSRKLRVRMSGEFGREFLVYFDVGEGYRSPVRIDIAGGQ